MKQTMLSKEKISLHPSSLLSYTRQLCTTSQMQPSSCCCCCVAGIVAYLNDDEEEQPALSSTSDTSAAPAMHVVAIGTGTKCLGASKRSAACDVINDSHAEVITRRAFVAWVYQQLQLAVELHKQTQQDAGPSQLQAEPRHKQQRQQQQQQQGTALAPSCRPAFVWCLDTRKFRLNSGVKFAMYVSQPPCGDASIYSSEQPAPSQQQQHQEQQQQQPAAAGRTGAKLIRLSGTADVGQAAAAIAGTAGEVAAEDPTSQPPHNSQQQQQQQQPQQQQGVLCVPCASDVEAGPQQLGVLRRKPGKGDPTLSLSCSDKLARWACLGLQGCLLSSCLDAPLYLDLLVVSVPPSSTAAATAAPASTAVGAGADEKQNQQHDEARLREVEAAGMRAFGSRLQGCSELLQPPFAVHAPVVVAVQAADSKLGLYPDDARRSPSGDCFICFISINNIRQLCLQLTSCVM
jgi:tRNA-specific adenosine deaminase 1